MQQQPVDRSAAQLISVMQNVPLHLKFDCSQLHTNLLSLGAYLYHAAIARAAPDRLAAHQLISVMQNMLLLESKCD